MSPRHEPTCEEIPGAGSPWEVCGALDVIAILDACRGRRRAVSSIDSRRCTPWVGASLAGATGQVDASAFEFVSGNGQIQGVQDFMEWLPRLLQA